MYASEAHCTRTRGFAARAHRRLVYEDLNSTNGTRDADCTSAPSCCRATGAVRVLCAPCHVVRMRRFVMAGLKTNREGDGEKCCGKDHALPHVMHRFGLNVMCRWARTPSRARVRLLLQRRARRHNYNRPCGPGLGLAAYSTHRARVPETCEARARVQGAEVAGSSPTSELGPTRP